MFVLCVVPNHAQIDNMGIAAWIPQSVYSVCCASSVGSIMVSCPIVPALSVWTLMDITDTMGTIGHHIFFKHYWTQQTSLEIMDTTDTTGTIENKAI